MTLAQAFLNTGWQVVQVMLYLAGFLVCLIPIVAMFEWLNRATFDRRRYHQIQSRRRRLQGRRFGRG